MSTDDAIAEDLTEKQMRWVEEYCGECLGNATEAARRAGYKGNDVTLAQVGAENLRKPHLKRAIERLNGKVRNSAIASVREVKERLTKVLRNDPEMHRPVVSASGRLVVDPRKITAEHRAFYATHERFPDDADVYFRAEVTPGDINRASMDLLKSEGALIENVSVKVEGGLMAIIAVVRPKMKPETFADLMQALEAVLAERGEK